MTELLIALALSLPAQPPVPKIDAGWELKIERANPAEPVFVGDDLDLVALTVTVKNTTDKERGFLPLARALRAHVLHIHITDQKGKLYGQLCNFAEPDDWKNLALVGAGKELRFPMTLRGPWGHGLLAPGKHTVALVYETTDGKVTSNALAFDAIEPAKDAILARHPLPVRGHALTRPAEERESAFVDQVKVGDKVYLLCRAYVGPKWGGSCEYTRRIDVLPGKVDMVVVGAYGSSLETGYERFHLAYPHKPNGMTTLRVQSIGFDIEERVVFDSDAKDPRWAGGPFEKTKINDRDYPPAALRLTYAAFVASVKGGGQAKFCLRSVEVSNRADPARDDRGTGINVPWMKDNFSPDVVLCRKEADGSFFFRTSTSSLWWIETRTEGWKLFVYTDKPIK